MVIFARMVCPGDLYYFQSSKQNRWLFLLGWGIQVKKLVTRDLLPVHPGKNNGLYGMVFSLGQRCPGKNDHIFLVPAIAAFIFAGTLLSQQK